MPYRHVLRATLHWQVPICQYYNVADGPYLTLKGACFNDSALAYYKSYELAKLHSAQRL